MTLTFEWLSVDRARNLGLDDLLVLNWEEIEDHKDVSPFDPDWPAYQALDRRGALKLGGLLQDGKLIGYNIFFLHKPLHHRSTLWAISDLVYLAPEHRAGRNGLFLLVEAEKRLREMGAKVILYGVKEGVDLSLKRDRGSVGALLAKMGYGSFDRSWSKAL